MGVSLDAVKGDLARGGKLPTEQMDQGNDHMKMKLSEKSIENQILTYLALKGALVWKNQTIGVYDPRKRIYRLPHNKFHRKGVPDILGIFNGKPLAIEVKSSTGRATPEQKLFIQEFKEAGGLAFVAKSVEDVKRELGL